MIVLGTLPPKPPSMTLRRTVAPTLWGRSARALVTSGLSKAYGLPGLKTHCKTALVIRQEGKTLLIASTDGSSKAQAFTIQQFTNVIFNTTLKPLDDALADLLNQRLGNRDPRGNIRHMGKSIG